MTKSASAAMITHLAEEVTSLALLLRVARTDGMVKGLTSHDVDIAYDDGDGVVTYVSAEGVDRTAISSGAGMEVDNLDVAGLFGAAGVTAEDFRVGRMDFAEIKIRAVNWASLSDGDILLRQGTVGEVVTASDFAASLRGLHERFRTEIVELTTPLCRAEFGDARCKVDIVGVAWSASLATTARAASDAAAETVVRPATPNDRWFVATNVGLTGPAKHAPQHCPGALTPA